MSSKVDELFGEDDTHVRPNIRTISILLTSGIVIALCGLLCTSVPGGLMVLWAWSMTEKEIDRVESGYLPEDVLPKLRVLKGVVWTALIAILFLFVVQTFLLISGFYIVLWSEIVQSFASSGPLPPI